MRPVFFRVCLLGLVIGLIPNDGAAELESGDRAWAARALRLDGDLARVETIESAVGAYEHALQADPASLVLRWKLLRSLHYVSEFSNAPESRKSEAVVEMVELANRSVELANAERGSDADRARVYFWSAIAWGARAQRVGLLTLVREGVAGKMRDFAERTVSLDPSVDRGGAMRLLSRLHATLPRVPFLTGWVDRDQVSSWAERAYAIDPRHVGNRMILALAYLESTPERRAEAVEILERIAAEVPDPEHLAEALAIRNTARDRLSELAREPR